MSPRSPIAFRAAVPFAELLEHLRRAGFAIGLDHYLRVQRLLEETSPEIGPEQVRDHLCCVIATSPVQQEAFRQIFDQLYPRFSEPTHRPGPTQDVSVSIPGTTTRPKPNMRRRQWKLLSGIGGFAVAALLFYLLSRRTGAPPTVRPGGETSVGTSGLQGPAATTPRPAAAPRVPESIQSPTGPLPGTTTVANRTPRVSWRSLAQALIVTVPLLLFLLGEWRRRRRRRIALEQRRHSRPPFQWPVTIPRLPGPYAGNEDLLLAARALRRRALGERTDLSIADTIAATIESAGYPLLRYRTLSTAPEYLVLVERHATRDHEAALFGDLCAALQREGVHVTRFGFEQDPRVCRGQGSEEPVALADLRRRYPSHRLLLFSRGDAFLDPITGRLAAWVPELLSWNDRALLTPEPVSRWRLREATLAGQFLVLPASLDALLTMVSVFGSESGEPNRAKATHWESPLPHLQHGDVVGALQRYLGPRVFRWLAACAVYPELHWDLTLLLGQLPALGGELVTEENLLRLVRLEWFRKGSIPDSVRAGLLDTLEPEADHAVRTALILALESNPAPAGTVASVPYELSLALQRLALHRGDPGGRRRVLRELRHFDRRALAVDQVTVRLLDDTRHSPLAVILPERLRQRIYREGLSVLGLKTGTRAAAAAGIVLVGSVLLRIPVSSRVIAKLPPPAPITRSVDTPRSNLDSLVLQSTTRTRPGPVLGGARIPAPVTQETTAVTEAVTLPLDSVLGLGVSPRIHPTTLEPATGLLGVRVLTRTRRMAPGDTVRFDAVAADRLGRRASIPLQWTSSNPRVLDVSPDGLARAIDTGVTILTVSGSGRTADVQVRVATGAPQPIMNPTLDTVAIAEITQKVHNLANMVSDARILGEVMTFPGTTQSQMASARATLEAFFRTERPVVNGVVTGDARLNSEKAIMPFFVNYVWRSGKGGNRSRIVRFEASLSQYEDGWKLSAVRLAELFSPDKLVPLPPILASPPVCHYVLAGQFSGPDIESLRGVAQTGDVDALMNVRFTPTIPSLTGLMGGTDARNGYLLPPTQEVPGHANGTGIRFTDPSCRK